MTDAIRGCSALTLFWSAGGNTRKVADAIHSALTEAGANARIEEITPDLDVDFYDYALIFCGAPVYHYLPPEDVVTFLDNQQRAHGRVEPSSPQRPGLHAVMFCTLGGPHTGFREGVPALKYMGQFFEHAGIPVVDEWAVVGEFHAESRQHMNLEGRLGDIRGRPGEQDLAEVRGKVHGLLRRLQHVLPGAERRP